MNSVVSFVHEGHPARVVFGAGVRARVAAEAERLGITRAHVVAPGRLVEEVVRDLGERAVGCSAGVVMHVPVELAEAARAMARSVRADGIVVVGGGSAVGLAKAIALDSGVPILAVPTSYAGSEMTSLWGLTEAGAKRTGRDERVRPRTVLYDPELTSTLPPAIAGPSGLNALAHAMEALYSPRLDPIVALLAEEGVRHIAAHLPLLARLAGDGREPGSVEASAGVLYGAWLAGVCLDRTTMGLHHKLCHVLGGSFALPHAEVHSVILPHVAAFNRAAAPQAMERLARALTPELASVEPAKGRPVGSPTESGGRLDGLGPSRGPQVPLQTGAAGVPAALRALAVEVGAPTSLAALGMKESDLDRAAALATENPYENPRPVDRASVRELLGDAFIGRLEPA